MYNNKVFRSLSNTDNGEVNEQTRFHYRQEGNTVWAEYNGGDIVHGHLLATVSPNNELDMVYHHVNQAGQLMTGRCHSTPEILPDGRIRLHERWQWTSGDLSSGESTLEEI
ncbi:n-acetylglutamate synthase [Tellurirhabdus bombi]|uniref:n-acetylglutamate synthase n=1 Tax=Tellurirhabdus bombi TaxID=2907205 RepID=UPI001F3D2C49|nr:n-acetylglutamate synthase [Tellurirhabdus bombi]